MKTKVEVRLCIRQFGKTAYHKKRDMTHAEKDALWYQARPRYEVWVETRTVEASDWLRA